MEQQLIYILIENITDSNLFTKLMLREFFFLVKQLLLLPILRALPPANTLM